MLVPEQEKSMELNKNTKGIQLHVRIWYLIKVQSADKDRTKFWGKIMTMEFLSQDWIDASNVKDDVFQCPWVDWRQDISDY